MKNRIITYIISLFLLSVILTGTTGITFSVHTCSSSQTTDMKIYPELFGMVMGCCCDEPVTSGVSDLGYTRQWLDMPGCCKTNHEFFKVIVFALTDPIQVSPSETLLFNTGGSPDALCMTEHDPFIYGLPLPPDPSPPPYGIDLVHFLNQAKIPCPVCS